jgi:HK97 family phage portal protein
VFLDRFIEQQRWSPRNPPADVLELLTGGKTTAGERVNPNSSLGLSAYFAGLRAISEDIAKLPLPVLKRLKPRGRERQLNSRVDFLLNVEVNPEMAAQPFRETICQHAMGWGGGYAEIMSDGPQPASMWLFDPDLVELKRDDDTRQLYYEVRSTERDEIRRLPTSKVFHVHGLGFNGLTGYSIARLARECIGSALGARKHGAALFGNASRPGGVVSYKNPIKDPKKWHDAWDAEFKASFNAHKTAILDNDAKYTPVSIPNKDAQWIEAQEFSVEEIARWFRMPPHKLQQLLRATFSNITEQNIEYVTDTLGAWMVRFEQEVGRKLLGGSRRSLYVEHNVSALLRGDPKARNESYAIGRQWGWWSANDVLEKENENPLPGEQGDIYLVPGNMVNADIVANPPEPPPVAPPVVPAEEPDAARMAVAERVRELAAASRGVVDRRLIERMVDAHLPLFADVYARLLRFETDRLRRKDEFDYSGHTERAAEMLEHCIAVCVASIGSLVPGGIPMEACAGDFAKGLAEQHVDISRELAQTGEEKDPRLKQWLPDRSGKQIASWRHTLVDYIVDLVEGPEWARRERN